MRRAKSVSLAKSSSGGSNFSGARNSDSDPASPLSGEAQTSPKRSTIAASAAILAGQGADGSNFLVALAGMRALGVHIQDASRGKRWKDRVMSWEERAGLGVPLAKLALGFLDVLGVSRAVVYKRLLENALRELLDKIPDLDEERMLLLLNDSFRYATQPDLKSVPLKIISSMSTVPDKVLEKIVDLQTHEPTQFEELGLPLSIKRLAWEKSPNLFVRVALPAAEKYVCSEFSPRMIAASQQVRYYARLDTVKRRNVMRKDKLQALAAYTERRPVLIGYLCDEIAKRYKAEASLAKAGLWATLLTDVLVTAREQSYGTIPDPMLDRLCALASRLDLAVKEDSFGDAAVRDVQRLFREATGIGEDRQDGEKTNTKTNTKSNTKATGVGEDRPEGEKTNTKTTKEASVTVEKAKQKDGVSKLNQVLKEACSEVSQEDQKNLFRYPVTETDAPGYHKVIKTPMDLSTALKKIKHGGYQSFGDFDRDLKLMWENCRTFNGPGTIYYKEADRQEKLWSTKSSSFENTLRKQQTSPSRPTPPAQHNSSCSSSGKRKAGSAAPAAQSPPQQDSPLAPMAPATQLDGQGLGRRVGLAALLLSEPFAAKLMYRHASERVPDACRRRETLPRDHPTMAPMLQLLELGDAARAMFRAESFGVRAVEKTLVRRVLPCVVALHTRAQDAIGRSKRRRKDAPLEDDSGGGSGGDEAGTSGDSAEQDTAEDPGFQEDWKNWYKEFPVVRRLICTMFCRAAVEGCDGAAALLMPAAMVAVKRMSDELWLWASLGEVLVGGATGGPKTGDGGKGVAKAGRGDKVGPHLSPETLKNILTLFSRGLESAAFSDAVLGESLKCVTSLLPVATPPVADVPPLTPPGGAGKPPGVPLAALEELVDKAVARAARPSRTPRSEAEERSVTDALEGVFAKAPSSWREKFSYRKKQAAAAAAAATTATGGTAGDGRPPRASRSVSIRGPKRKAGDSVDAEGGCSAAVKKNRR